MARDFLANLKLENTVYQHNGYVRWKGDKGIFSDVKENEARTDCSGFVNEILLKAKSKTYDIVHQKTYWRSYPKASSYYDAITQNLGFTQRASILDVTPGDILAVKFETESNNTGHVMIVDKVGKMERDIKPIIGGTIQWKVTVIDSSSAHGKDDTRYVDGKRLTGVGRGSYRVYTDEAGRFIGYASSPESKKFYPVASRPAAFGTPF